MADTEAELLSLDKQIHLLDYRLTQLENARLPVRVSEVESTVHAMDENIDDLRAVINRTNELVNTIRGEVNADLVELESNLRTRVGEVERGMHEKMDKIDNALKMLVVRTVSFTAGAAFVGSALFWLIDEMGGMKNFLLAVLQ